MSIRQIRQQKKRYGNGGIVRALDDMELFFGEVLLDEIRELYQEGYSAEVIGKEVNRDPDEIFIALFHMARQGIDINPFAKRLRA